MRFSLFLGVFFLKTRNINLSWITTKIYIILLEFSLIPKIWTNPPQFKKNPRLKKKIIIGTPFTMKEHHYVLFYFSVTELQNRVITLDEEEWKTMC